MKQLARDAGESGGEDEVIVDVGVMNCSGKVWIRPDMLHDEEV